MKTGWIAGACSARDVALSAPRRCPRWTHAARRPYAVMAWTTSRPSWPGPAGRATWSACAPLGRPMPPRPPPPSHSAGCSTTPPRSTRHRHRSELAVRSAFHRPSSSPSTTLASTHTPWTLLCTRIGQPTRLLAGIAGTAADRRPPRRRPSPEPSPAKPTPPSE
jgi:hypothetical protein